MLGKKDFILRFAQDLVLSVSASIFAFLLLRGVTEPMNGFLSRLAVWAGSAAVASSIGFYISNFYKRERAYASIGSVLHLMSAIIIKELILMVVILGKLVEVKFPVEFSVLMLSDLVFTLMMCQFVHISRGVGRKDVPQLSSSKTALVVGTDASAISLAHYLDKSDEFTVVGLVSADKSLDGHIMADYPIFFSDSPDDIEHLRWKLGGIDCIFFPRTNSSPDGEDALSEESIQTKNSFSRTDLFVKRAFDFTASLILLLIFSPLIALCALFIKLDDGGPVFYLQERVGKGGRLFRLVKFRSMRTDAESIGVPALCSGEQDPRLTRVGRFLRAHHLDELPQLWNVLVGDMSFVGWRPERVYFVKQIIARDSRYRYLLQLAPGVTSYATLYNGYTDTLDKMITRLDQDIYYLRSRTIWFDAKILALTFLSIVSGKKF